MSVDAAAELERLALQKRIAGSGRITHFRSASCRWIGQPKACAHSTIAE